MTAKQVYNMVFDHIHFNAKCDIQEWFLSSIAPLLGQLSRLKQMLYKTMQWFDRFCDSGRTDHDGN